MCGSGRQLEALAKVASPSLVHLASSPWHLVHGDAWLAHTKEFEELSVDLRQRQAAGGPSEGGFP
jgi:hypothetical protein